MKLSGIIIAIVFSASLLQGATLTVRANFVDKPLPGVTITLTSDLGEEHVVFTGVEGFTIADLKPGHYSVVASLVSFAPDHEDIYVPARAASISMQLQGSRECWGDTIEAVAPGQTLPPRSEPLTTSYSGKVLDEAGKPMENVKVGVRDDGLDPAAAGVSAPTRTRRDGTFVIEALRSRDRGLEFSKRGYRTKKIDRPCEPEFQSNITIRMHRP